jgi:geranylgeranyl pyrophosphate synthase
MTPATPTASPKPPLPIAPRRPAQKNIPAALRDRRRILFEARAFVAQSKPVPPIPLDELRANAAKILAQLGLDPIYQDYAAVVVNNEVWRDRFASVPFERRMLLLAKCLRPETQCPASFDEVGLLCERCGLCPIDDLIREGEALGYAVLVAEGSAVVANLIKSGKIEAVLGVGCLNVLKKSFPHMEAAAAAGIAIPLLQDDCANTSADLDWVWDYMRLTTDEGARRLDLDRLRAEVSTCFELTTLDAILGPAQGATEVIAREWLSRAGKRWRPFLTMASHQALTGAKGAPSEDLRRIAIAVECFHKASLIHDDIEDNDALRYGEKTLHAEHGVAVALNVGDFLIGEGYRILSEREADAGAKTEMIRAASEAQRALCQGQGAELIWARQRSPLQPQEVLDIFRLKTAPAFEVALSLGVIAAGKHAEYRDALRQYSAALGVAYQIRDDLADFDAEGGTGDIAGMRPSLVLALALERATGADRDFLERVWRGELRPEAVAVEKLCLELGAAEEGERLQAEYKNTAINSLNNLADPELKALLWRVVGRIFNETEFSGWCAEQQKRNSDNSASAAAPA